MLPAINNKLPSDPLKDFVPIARVADVPLVLLVHPALPARTPRELLELARKRPGEINFGSTGLGSMTHLGMLLFNTMGGVRMEHVACKGLPYTDLMAGVLQAGTREALTRLGSETYFSGNEAFAAFLRADHARWVKLARDAAIRR